MSLKTVLNHWPRNEVINGVPFQTDFTPRRPRPEVIGFIVAWDREAKQMSMEALASLARVSVSTIERIERCQPVSQEVLRRVAVALGRKEGAFVDIRVPLAPEKALTLLEESIKWVDGTVAFPVQQLRTHRQLRALTDSVAVLVDGSRLREDLDNLIGNLEDYLGLASFCRAQQSGMIQGGSNVKLRPFYNEVLEAVRTIERAGCAVALAGTYQAKVGPNGLMAGRTVKAGVISFFPKSTDPCASKRSFLCGPEIIDINWDD